MQLTTMNSVELQKVLEATVSSDIVALQAAQRYLENAAATNLELLLSELSNILVNTGQSENTRKVSAIQIKNYLTSKDDNVKLQYQQRWLSFEASNKAGIKANIIRTLGTESSHPSNAAQCVAAIAQVELPLNQWPDLIEILVNSITTTGSPDTLKESSIEALGYIVEDIDPAVLIQKSNLILTAIVNSMRQEEKNKRVRVAGAKALLNALEFCKDQFDRNDERNVIMQVICECTQTPNANLTVASLQCLSRAMSLYYKYMEFYMGQALFAITVDALESSEDDIALQGIEFWSTACEEELDLAIEAQEAAELGEPPDVVSKHYMLGALQFVVPLLLKRLTVQEEYDDGSDWNPNKAAVVCLMLIAQCCESAVVQHVIPFTEQISHQDWRFRDAAVMCFGCIVDGPDPTVLNQHTWNMIPHLVRMLKGDPSLAVRDTCAWTLGRICQFLPQTILQHNSVNDLIDALLLSLDNVSRVAANACWAFSSLAKSAHKSALEAMGEKEDELQTYVLSRTFQNIVDKLLATTDRPDGNQNNLRSGAYDAVMELLKTSPVDCYPVVQTTTVNIINRLQQILLHRQTSNDNNSNLKDLQCHLCATLTYVIRRMKQGDAIQISEAVMSAFLMMMSTNEQSSDVQEEVLMAIGVVIEVTEKNFAKFMDKFWPYLIASLQNHAEYSVCEAAVAIVGDMCRTFGMEMGSFSDQLMEQLVNALSDTQLHQSVRPSILRTFGDIALAIRQNFVKYLPLTMHILKTASEATVDTNDYDMMEYFNDLRESILEAYSEIVQGLMEEDGTIGQLEALRQYLGPMIQLIISVGVDRDKTDDLLKCACGLLGDIAKGYSFTIKDMVAQDSIGELLTQGRRSRDSETKKVAQWASREMRKINAL